MTVYRKKTEFVTIADDQYTLLVLNSAPYINQIALAVVPSWANSYCFVMFSPLLDLGCKSCADPMPHTIPNIKGPMFLPKTGQ